MLHVFWNKTKTVTLLKEGSALLVSLWAIDFVFCSQLVIPQGSYSDGDADQVSTQFLQTSWPLIRKMALEFWHHLNYNTNVLANIL